MKILKYIVTLFISMSNSDDLEASQHLQPTIIEAKQVNVLSNTDVIQTTPSIAIIDDSTSEINNELKMKIYSRAKVVKWLAIIDMTFLSINFVFSLLNNNLLWMLFIFFPLCFFGYNGAKKYKTTQLLGYVGYLGGMTVYYLILMFYYNNFWWLIIFFFEMYILYYTSKLYNLMRLSPPSVIESLQEGWDPSELVYYYY